MIKNFSLPSKIHGREIVLKKNVLEQAEEIFTCINSDRQRLREFMHWVDKTTTLEDEINFIKTSEIFMGKPMRAYGMFRNDKYIGNISVLNIDLQHDTCELGYWLHGDYEGKGLVSDAINALENELFLQGFKRIELAIEGSNERSIDVAKRNRYDYETTVHRNMYDKDLELMIFVKIV